MEELEIESEKLITFVKSEPIKSEPIDTESIKIESPTEPELFEYVSIKGSPMESFEDDETEAPNQRLTTTENTEKMSILHCKFCNEKFPTKREFTNHRMNICKLRTDEIDPNNPYQTQDKSLTYKYTLAKQIQTLGTEKLYQCELCDRSFTRSNSIWRHTLKFHKNENKIYNCEHCDKTFINKMQILHHQRFHAEHKPYKCQFCDKSFVSKKSAYNHSMSHENQKSLSSGENTMKRLEILQIDESFKCPYCHASFAYKEGLSSHIERHKTPRSFRCDYCPKSFTYSRSLSIHLRIHKNDKPFKCDICDTAYVDKQGFDVHMKKHEDPNNQYECKVCHKRFLQRKLYTEHTRLHTKDKLYFCPICEQSFSRTNNLTKHIMNHTSQTDQSWIKDMLAK